MKDNGSVLFLLPSLERGGTGVDGPPVNSSSFFSVSPFSPWPLSCLSPPIFLPLSPSSFPSSSPRATLSVARLSWPLQKRDLLAFSSVPPPSFLSPVPLAGLTGDGRDHEV